MMVRPTLLALRLAHFPRMKAEMPGLINTSRLTWVQNKLFSLGDRSLYEDGVVTPIC
jgi:hypothetical protein